MGWQEVKMAFFVDGKHIDIGVCTNCNGIHIPPEEANGCCDSNHKEETYEEIKARYSKYQDRKIGGRKPVTVSLKVDLLDEYSKYCKEQGMVLSRRLEALLKKDLESLKKD